MTNKTIQAWGAGCGQSLLIRLFAAALVGLAMLVCIGLAAIVPLPAGVDRQMVLLLAFMAAVLGSIALTLVGAVGVVVWRGRRLDAAFAPLGLTPSQYLLNGRQYHGQVNGRQVDIYFYRGPTLDVHVGTPLRTRLSIGRRDRVGLALAGLANRQPLPLADPQLANLAVFPLDAAWAQGVLAEPAVRDLVLRLMDDTAPGAGAFEIRQLLLQPEALLLRHYRTRAGGQTAEAVRGWLNDLSALLRLLETAPPPTATAEAGGLERTLRSDRNTLTTRIYLITFGVLGVMLACAVVFAIVVVLLASAGG